MNPLKEIIIEKIRKEGYITFETFMEMALYYPELGYYTSKSLCIGRSGDFYTSPYLHPIFGAVIGRQLMEMWMAMGRLNDFHAVEIGGGAGYLCKDIFDYLNKESADTWLSDEKWEFLKSLRYVIVELNPYIHESQKRLLGKHAERIKWVSTLKDLTKDVNGCIFSNELLDSFPVHIVEMEDKPKEVYLTINNNEIIEHKQDISTTDLINYLNQFSINLPRGYRTEINLRIREWLGDVASILKRGFLLTIDYGYTSEEYYSEERRNGTLLCYHKHRISENPYEHIGEQDITAHVNFSSLEIWGEESGLKTIGCCSQGTFVVASGIDDVITELYTNSPDYLFHVMGIKGLIFPQGMGESHKVMIQYKGEGVPKLQGFSLSNQMNTL